MNNIATLKLILAKIAVLVTMVASLTGGAAAPAGKPQSFGLLQNTTYAGATSTAVGALPYVQSINNLDSSLNLQPSGLFYAANGNSTSVSLGASSTNNGVNLWVVGTSTAINGTTTAIIFGVPTSTTPGTTTVINVTQGLATTGLQVGDPCFASTNVTSTSADLLVSCAITSTATTTASATISYFNGGAASLTVPTGTVIRYEIHHLAF